MSFTPADSEIFAPLFGTPELAAIFSDAQFVRALLRVEGALARTQGALGIIPRDAAEKISTTCETMRVDMARLQTGTRQDGFPIIALVKQIQVYVGEEVAPFVHWGATTQDIMDTALVLQMRDALVWCETKLREVIRGLAALTEKYRATLMAGRTHSQHALPITFGFQTAMWLAPLLRHARRLEEWKPRVLMIQFGGAVGTLAALVARHHAQRSPDANGVMTREGENGIVVQNALARELDLGVPLMAWHTQRDSLAEAANWLSLVSASLGKMAQDIILLAQTEIGEVRESDDATRGGSSTMPQKSNPIVSELVIAAARANASLLSNMHHALIQEHARGTHGWQLEWLTLPQMFANTGAALQHAIFLSENLVVNETRMLENVRASNGLMLAEAISFALAQYLPRAQAKQIVARACQTALAEKRHLADVVREQTDAPCDWAMLREEKNYLGAADALIERVLREARGT